MASWVAKLQSTYLAVGLVLALVHLHSTWVADHVPGGASGRSLLQTKTNQKVRAVNLGGWLVLEGWIKPSLFAAENLPADPDLLDGTQVTLKSNFHNPNGLFVSAEKGGGSILSCNRTSASTWETFKIWRVSPGVYQLRVDNGKFVNAVNNGGGIVQATATIPQGWETFTFTRLNVKYATDADGNSVTTCLVHIKAGNGNYFQAANPNQVTADFVGEPDVWNSAATFIMETGANFQGEFQLANAWGAGAAEAKAVFQNHRDTFITEKDFAWLSSHGINAVRVPVGWWIASDPNPPPPFVSGALQCLDNAFLWGNAHGINIIIDLHAAPGSQNGQQHSATRDGVWQWAQNSTCRAQSIQAIDFLANRYAKNAAFLGMELLNEPFNTAAAPAVPDVQVLDEYYQTGYATVRKHSATAFVVMCQVIGASDDEIVTMANLFPANDNVCIDIHQYNSFDDSFSQMSVQQNIDYVNNQRHSFLTRLNQAKAYTFVGEWTGYFDCETTPTQTDYYNFAAAEENVFGQATFGWSQWSYRNVEDRWSYYTSVNEGYMPENPVN